MNRDSGHREPKAMGLQLQRMKSARQQANHGLPAESAELNRRYSLAAILETVVVGDRQKKMSASPENTVDLVDGSFRVLKILQSLQCDYEIETLGCKRQPVEVGAKILSRVIARGASQGTR